MDKAEIRRQVRAAAKEFTEKERLLISTTVCETLLQHARIEEAETVIAFSPLPDEIDIFPMVRDLYSRGKEILLPRVVSDEDMVLCRYSGEGSMSVGRYGIREPFGEEVTVCQLLSKASSAKGVVAIVPGVAFDSLGHRVGRGKGYYDRFLSSLPIYTIGVCFPYQLFDSVPFESHDKVLDEVILCSQR